MKRVLKAVGTTLIALSLLLMPGCASLKLSPMEGIDIELQADVQRSGFSFGFDNQEIICAIDERTFGLSSLESYCASVRIPEE